MKKHLNLYITGKVQRIGFRFSCMQTAYKWGITGIVRNKSDGSLYVEAEGDEEQLKHFVEWCKKGPIWARVDDLRAETGELKNYKAFDISR
ncbi:MAG: acylphosphatase [Bacteroidales bacterium]|nr:acylphosphatase [Bacteroidales bacterium]